MGGSLRRIFGEIEVQSKTLDVPFFSEDIARRTEGLAPLVERCPRRFNIPVLGKSCLHVASIGLGRAVPVLSL